MRLLWLRRRLQKAPVKKQSSGADAIDAIKDHPIFTAVLKGSKGTILDEVKKALDAGVKPDAIINDYLIAAINEVGVLFDKKKYFLPQLIGSANTMKKAIDYLEPMLRAPRGCRPDADACDCYSRRRYS